MLTIPYVSEQPIRPAIHDVANNLGFGKVRLVKSKDGKGIHFGVETHTEVWTYSPNMLLAKPNMASLLHSAIRLYINPEQRAVLNVDYVVTSDLSKLTGNTWVIDIETAGDLDGEPEDRPQLSIGIWDGNADNPVHVIPGDQYPENLGELLSSKNLICHHSQFDLKDLNYWLGTKLRARHDTMVMHYALHSGAGAHGLKALCRLYLGVDDWDRDAKKYTTRGKDYSNIPSEILYEYNAKDVYYTAKLWQFLNSELGSEARRFYEKRMKQSHFLQSIEESKGIYIDVPYFQRLDKEMSNELSVMLENIPVNPNSPKQVKELFGTKSSDEKTLKGLEHPIAQRILDFRKTKKLHGTYVVGILKRVKDSYIHPRFKITATVTGRLASENPNAQNIPRTSPVKRGLCAPPGYKVVSADYSQIEARVMAVLSGDKNMQSVFQKDSPDFFDVLIPLMFPEEFPTYEDYRRFKYDEHDGHDAHYRTIAKGCVPLSTKILTQRGWMSHNEVRIGDKTPGLTEYGKTEWTTITDVLHWDSKPLYSLGHKKWNVEVTDNHRWAVANTDRIYKKGDYSYEMLETKDIVLKSSSLFVAGRLEGELDRPDLTTDEVRLLAWVASDGYLRISERTHTTSQGDDGRRQQFLAQIIQSKPQYVSEIENMLERMGVEHVADRRPGINYEHVVTFRLRSSYARELYRRAGLDTEDYETFILSLGTKQREAFLEVFCWAEGHVDQTGQWLITQNEGMKHDAIVLCASLLGYRTTSVVHTKGGKCRRIRLAKVPYVGMTTGKLTYLREAPVWCVTTELGTWTAKDHNKVFVTGNCVYGLSFGRQAKAIGEATGLTEAEAQKIINNYFKAYPDLYKWRKGIAELVKTNSLYALTGMRFQQEIYWPNPVFASGLERSALSFMPQHHANECLLGGMMLFQEKLDPEHGYIHGLIHDDGKVYIKEEYAEHYAQLLSECMEKSATDLLGDAVVFPAEPVIKDSWEEEDEE